MYYFASDMHLGSPHGILSSKDRERCVVSWLEKAGLDAKAIFLVGDVFDFWFEYRRVVPKGFTRLLGKLSELTDRGVEIHLFAGNHDMWMLDYLETECGVELHARDEIYTLNGKRVYISHGDRINDKGLLGRCFRSSTLRWLFSRLVHPTYAMAFGHSWSSHSRTSKHTGYHTFKGDNEPMVRFAKEMISRGEKIDYFVFGHIHYSGTWDIYSSTGEKSTIVFTGDWLKGMDYVIMGEDGVMDIRQYDPASDKLKLSLR